MNRKIAGAVVAVAGLVLLTGCADANDPEQMTSRCEGIDKVYVLDDPNRGSSLFVVHNHPECSNGGAR